MEHSLVLVVDEDEATATLLKSALPGNYQILMFKLGSRAVQLSKSEHLHFIVLSDCLPDTGIINLIKVFKNKFPQTPIIVISEFADKDNILDAFRNGADDFLEKPLSIDSLTAVCSRILDEQQAGDFDSLTNDATKTHQSLPPGQKGAHINPHNWIDWSKRLFRGMLAQHHIHVEHNTTSQNDKLPQVNQPLLQVFFLGRFHIILNDLAIECRNGEHRLSCLTTSFHLYADSNVGHTLDTLDNGI